MSSKSTIEWTDATWTPIRARVKPDAAEIARAKGYASLVQIAEKMTGHVGPHCEHCSPGCDNCYAEANNSRCLPSNGTGLPFDRRARDLVDLFMDEKILMQPLRWRSARRVFVCSQTDLFGEFYTDEMIDRVFAVTALCPQHTFQVLTKRAKRMREWATNRYRGESVRRAIPDRIQRNFPIIWPLPNVHVGVSVEDQHRKDRIDHLRETPAAVRFISFEPLLEDLGELDLRGIDLAIWGGESGPGARPCNTEWIRNGMKQADRDGCLNFVKQLGAHVIQGGVRRKKADKKGGDMDEWEHDLRVRDLPQMRNAG